MNSLTLPPQVSMGVETESRRVLLYTLPVGLRYDFRVIKKAATIKEPKYRHKTIGWRGILKELRISPPKPDNFQIKNTYSAITAVRNTFGSSETYLLIKASPMRDLKDLTHTATILKSVKAISRNGIPDPTEAEEVILHVLAWIADHAGDKYIGEPSYEGTLAKILPPGQPASLIGGSIRRKTLPVLIWSRKIFPRTPRLDVEVITTWK